MNSSNRQAQFGQAKASTPFSPCAQPLLYSSGSISLYHGLEQPHGGAAHCHDALQISLPLTGSVCSEWQLPSGGMHRGQTLPGSFSLRAPNQPHAACFETETEIVVAWMPSVVFQAATEEIGAAPETPLMPSINGVSDPLLQELILSLMRELRQHATPARLYVESAANFLGLHLARHYSTAKSPSSTSEPLPSNISGLTKLRLRRVLNHIEDNLSADIALADLADAAGLSASHFSSSFRHSTGLSAYQYVLKRRVERAAELLRVGRLPIGEIAQLVGFCDQSQLTRHFKQRMGLTPRAFVQSLS